LPAQLPWWRVSSPQRAMSIGVDEHALRPQWPPPLTDCTGWPSRDDPGIPVAVPAPGIGCADGVHELSFLVLVARGWRQTQVAARGEGVDPDRRCISKRSLARCVWRVGHSSGFACGSIGPVPAYPRVYLPSRWSGGSITSQGQGAVVRAGEGI